MTERRTGQERVKRAVTLHILAIGDPQSIEPYRQARDAIASDLDALAAAREAAESVKSLLIVECLQDDYNDQVQSDALRALLSALDGKREGT